MTNTRRCKRSPNACHRRRRLHHQLLPPLRLSHLQVTSKRLSLKRYMLLLRLLKELRSRLDLSQMQTGYDRGRADCWGWWKTMTTMRWLSGQSPARLTRWLTLAATRMRKKLLKKRSRP